MKKLNRLEEFRATRPALSAKASRTLTRVLTLAMLVFAAVALTTGAVAANRQGAVVKLGHSSLGRIIVGSHGRTLYLWAHDKRGKSTCYGACASYWPPLITRGKPRAISGARRALVGTTRRRDGKIQVTYHGHPLYRFSGDGRAGQTAGEGLTDFGGRWYAVSAAGTAVQKGSMYSAFKRPKLRHGLLTIEGTKASDKIALRLQAGNPGILQVDVGDDGSADFSFKRKHVAKIALDARAGDDLVRIDEANGVFSDVIPTTLDGGAGNDTLAGGSGAEKLLGGDGNDSIDGNGGNDIADLGAGDDTFFWDPGDGSDTIEGGGGADTMVFNGAAASETVTVSANGDRLTFFRNPANITMDTRGVETVDFNALGGADVITVNDLTGTGVTNVRVDLAGTMGGSAGDSATDRVIVNGTNGDDHIVVSGGTTGVRTSGLAPTVDVVHSEVANDRLELNTLAGSDTVDPSALTAGAIQLLVDGVPVP
jgi:predicted lipoprotein with Yx(FWY)xxD motif